MNIFLAKSNEARPDLVFHRLPGETDVERLQRLILVVRSRMDQGADVFGRHLLDRLVGELNHIQTHH